MVTEVDRKQVLAYRAAAQGLDRSAGSASKLAVFDIGFQDTAAGSAAIGLAARLPDARSNEDLLADKVTSWSEGKRFEAEVTSEYRQCEVRREVAIRKVRPGKNPRTVAVKTTNRIGRVQLRNDYGAGRYFALARTKQFTDQFDNPGTCLTAQSDPVRVPAR